MWNILNSSIPKNFERLCQLRSELWASQTVNHKIYGGVYDHQVVGNAVHTPLKYIWMLVTLPIFRGKSYIKRLIEADIKYIFGLLFYFKRNFWAK